jgi:hypothetical protein
MHPADRELQKLINESPLNVKKVMDYLALGANPNSINAKGVPLLHLLLYAKAKQEMFTLIEKYHVNVNTINFNNKQILIETLLSKNVDVIGIYDFKDIERLMKAGVNPNVKNTFGEPLLHRVIRQAAAQSAKWIFDTLIGKYKANIHITNEKTGMTALQIMLGNPNMSLENCMQLVRLGADPNTEDVQGNSLLSKLVTAGSQDLARELIGLIQRREAVPATFSTLPVPLREPSDCKFSQTKSESLYPNLTQALAIAPVAVQRMAPASSPPQADLIEKGRKLYALLTHPEMTQRMAQSLATSWTYEGQTYRNNNKEMVLAYINSLAPEEQRVALNKALDKGSYYNTGKSGYAVHNSKASPLYVFFSQKRGLTETTYRAGSFKRLFAMHDALWLAEAYQREERNEEPVAPPLPISEDALLAYIQSLSMPHQKKMVDLAFLKGNTVYNSFTYTQAGRTWAHARSYHALNQLKDNFNQTRGGIKSAYQFATKEIAIAHIERLPQDQKSAKLKEALTPGTDLYSFFALPRGFFNTSMQAGSFKKLGEMQDAMVMEAAIRGC